MQLLALSLLAQEAGAVNTLVHQVAAALSSIVIKKPEFDAILLTTALIKSNSKQLDTQTNILNTCLIATALASYLPAANALVNQNRQLLCICQEHLWYLTGIMSVFNHDLVQNMNVSLACLNKHDSSFIAI